MPAFWFIHFLIIPDEWLKNLRASSRGGDRDTVVTPRLDYNINSRLISENHARGVQFLYLICWDWSPSSTSVQSHKALRLQIKDCKQNNPAARLSTLARKASPDINFCDPGGLVLGDPFPKRTSTGSISETKTMHNWPQQRYCRKKTTNRLFHTQTNMENGKNRSFVICPIPPFSVKCKR